MMHHRSSSVICLRPSPPALLLKILGGHDLTLPPTTYNQNYDTTYCCGNSSKLCTHIYSFHHTMTVSGLLNAVFDLANSIVEIYLAKIIKPFLVLHEQAYKALNTILRAILDDHSSQIPDWFTANAITYVRTLMIIPCIFLMNTGHTILPSLIILSVDFGDFLDGVVARFWVDQKAIEAVAQAADAESKDKVIMQDSWVVAHRNKNYGGFIDAVCDKVFVVPCWICLLASVPDAGHVRILQYVVLWALILTEAASGSIRFKAYYTSNGVSAPTIKGFDFSSSAVKVSSLDI